MPAAKKLKFPVNDKAGAVSALLLRPEKARAMYLFAHGAGAGMTHRFMEAAAEKLGGRGIATLRYQFPYTEKGGKRPDNEATLVATVRAAVAAAGKHAGDLPLFAGGKSMGGRMTSLAAAKEPLAGVRGLIFFGFPLYAPGKPSSTRGEHLLNVGVPLLFLQGSRDAFADLKLLKPLAARVKRAELFAVEGGDHSFHMLKSSGRSDDEVLDEIAGKAAHWIDAILR